MIHKTPSMPDSDDQIAAILQTIRDVLAKGSANPAKLHINDQNRQILEALLSDLALLDSFSFHLSNGNLSPEFRMRGKMAGNLKALQANMRHITWQAQQVAKGDFTQRISFLGDFSVVFNSMVERLECAQTERKVYEQILGNKNQELTDEIEERKRALDVLFQTNNKLNMLNNITRHDILNQLMGLRTYLELSKMDVIDPVFLNYIQKEEQAAEAIQLMIEFTRDYQDIGGHVPKWHILSDTISSAISQLKPPNVEINVAVDRAEVFADPLLEKVFYNLMENSLRHGEHVTRMDFSVKESENGLILTYADNGVGVTAEDKKKLFVKGFGKHTGLGLFLSKEILSITGITITEKGKSGKGARFKITVPNGAWRLLDKK